MTVLKSVFSIILALFTFNSALAQTWIADDTGEYRMVQSDRTESGESVFISCSPKNSHLVIGGFPVFTSNESECHYLESLLESGIISQVLGLKLTVIVENVKGQEIRRLVTYSMPQ